ncbi:hypothetical protein [Aureliella helgolandensis]|uniref:Uncharacterized protein n=1 Tax=Aureliella helgolandensis TaxID=2527968 RepID=A0A518G8S6_9BACT|nr:hypothetical protein [Aureliella helgolandensis]QDV24995.1 hypothetical protein Q31a_33170 [Aureliella helgolandensis]
MMHSVDVLEEALELARQSGFEVRHEWLGEATGGACRIGSRRLLFVDLSLTADEQLQQVVTALRACEVRDWPLSTSRALQRLLS